MPSVVPKASNPSPGLAKRQTKQPIYEAWRHGAGTMLKISSVSSFLASLITPRWAAQSKRFGRDIRVTLITWHLHAPTALRVPQRCATFYSIAMSYTAARV
jgi:hypothetical protein